MRRAFNSLSPGGRTLTALIVLALLSAGGVLAFWSAAGSGSASGSLATLSAPTITGATAGAGSATLSWTSVTPPGPGAVTYHVKRDGGAAGGNCPSSASPTSVTSCTDSGVSAGAHTYTVTAVWRSWTAASAPASVEVASATATHLVLAASSVTPTAGAGDNLTITAKNAANETVSGYTGAKSLTFGGAGGIGSNQPTVNSTSGAPVAFGTATTITFTNGVAAVSGVANGVMTLYKAETANVTVTDGTIGNGSGLAVTVGPASAASFTLPTPSTQTAGGAFEETLTAKDSFGNTARAYTGAKTVAFSGPASSPNATAPKYPVSVTFAEGIGKASITLYKAESTTLTAKEGSVSGSTGSFTVASASAASFTLGAVSMTPTAGEADNLTISALDAYGNAAAGYSGSKTLTFGGASTIGSNKPTVSNSSGVAVSFGSATAITFAGGTSSVSAASNGVMRLYAAESASITVSDGAITNGTGLVVSVAAAATASLTLATPATQTAGSAFNLGVTAKDTYGNGVSGPLSLTFSGPTNSPSGSAPTYPSSVTFAGGSGTAAITLRNAQTTTITATLGAVSGTSGAFSVNPGAAASLSLSATSSTPTAGVADNLSVTALDSFRNTATTYTGSHNLTFSGAATIGANKPTVSSSSGTATSFGTATAISFASGVSTVSGSNNGVMKLYKAETASITATDGTLSTSASLAVTTGSASAASLLLAPASNTPTAGAADNLVITALDTFGNTATAYTASHNLTFAGASALGANTPTVTNSSGAAIKFGTATAITFANGVASVTGSSNGVMKLYKAESAKITTTDGTLSNGTGVTVTVAASAQQALEYVKTSAGTENACPTGLVEVGNGGTFTAFVAVVDAFGNLTANGGSALTVTLAKTSGPGNAPSPGSLTVSANANPAVTSGSSGMKIPTGNPAPTVYTATSGALASVACTVER